MRTCCRYVDGFSDNVRDVFTRFGFEEQVQRLDEANALYLVLQKFAAVDLRPSTVSNTDMGTIFEELIRKFAEAMQRDRWGALHTP